MRSGIFTTHCVISEPVKSKVEEILSIAKDDLFPCLFGKKAAKDRSLFWLFHDSNHHPENFINGLIEYTDFIHQTPPKDRLLRPLIVLIKNDKRTLSDQQKLAWLLGFMRLYPEEELAVVQRIIPDQKPA